MFELVILIVAMFIFGYFYYKSTMNRSKSLIEKIINQKHKEENYDEENKK